jgi:hypothetical protein
MATTTKIPPGTLVQIFLTAQNEDGRGSTGTVTLFARVTLTFPGGEGKRSRVIRYTTAIPAVLPDTFTGRIDAAKQAQVQIGHLFAPSALQNLTAVQFQTTSSTNVQIPFVGLTLGALVTDASSTVIHATVNFEFTFPQQREDGFWSCHSIATKQKRIGVVRYSGPIALAPGVEVLVGSGRF